MAEEEKDEEVKSEETKTAETPPNDVHSADTSEIQKSVDATKEISALEDAVKKEKAALEASTAHEKSELEQFAATTKNTGIISAINESYGKASEKYNDAVRTEGSPVKEAYELRDKLNNMQSAYGEFNKQKGEIGEKMAVNYALSTATGDINSATGTGTANSITGERLAGTGGNASTSMQMPDSVTENGQDISNLVRQLRQGKNPNLSGGDNKAQQISDLVQTASAQQPTQSGQEKGFWRRTDDEFKAALDLGDKMLKDTPIVGEMHRQFSAEMKVAEGIEKANPLFANTDMSQARDGLAGRIASVQEGDVSRAITGRDQKPNNREVINAMRQGKNPLDASQNKEKPQKAKSPIDAKQMTTLINIAKSDVVKS